MLMTATHGPDVAVTMTRVVRTAATRVRSRVEPLHLAAVGVAGLVLGATVKPLSETDLFWHVPLGQQILHSHHVLGAGANWTIKPGTGGWVSSEWLGEVALALTRNHFGWHAILWLRLIFAALLVGSSLALVLRTSTARVAVVTMAAIGIPLASGIQERPQLLSLLLLCPTAVWAHRILTTGRFPSLWLTAPLVFGWAQVHSLWLVLPAALALAAACRTLDLGRAGLRTLRPAALHVCALLVAGSLTPIGPRALLLPVTLHSATSRIAEWQPSSPLDTMSWGLMLLTALMVMAWSRHGRGRVPTSEIAFTGAMVLFGLMAYRNLLPALLLLVPLVTTRLSQMRWARASRVTASESRVLRLGCIAALIGGLAVSAARTAASATFADSVPIAIAHTLAAEPGEHRVLNAYNASGALVAFGGPQLRLAVDGRADRWGSAYLNGYFDALSMKGDWRAYISTLAATDAVLASDAPIVGELLRDGWIKQLADHHYVLLKAPTL